MILNFTQFYSLNVLLFESVHLLTLQHIDCVILDDGGFLLMSNNDKYIELVSYQ